MTPTVMTPTSICILAPSLEDPAPYMLAARALYPNAEVSTRRAPGSRVLLDVDGVIMLRDAGPQTRAHRAMATQTARAILQRVADDAARDGRRLPPGAVRARVR